MNKKLKATLARWFAPKEKASDCSYCYWMKYRDANNNPDIKIRKHMKGHGVCKSCYYALR